MQVLVNLARRYGESRAGRFLTWSIIALGLVPAIASEGILPFDILSFRFAIGDFVFLPARACLLIFLLGLLGCITQQRYLMSLLLLPWLALYAYDIDQLTFRLPSYLQGQNMLLANYQWSREQDTPPQAQQLILELEDIRHPQNPLQSIHIKNTTDKLDDLAKQTRTKPGKRSETALELINNILAKSELLEETRQQITVTNKTGATNKWVELFGAGQVDKNIAVKLEDSRQVLFERHDSLQERLNLLRASLDDLYQAEVAKNDALASLYDLRAEIATAQWASQSYETWRFSQVFKSLCFLVLLVLIWRFPLNSWIFLATLGISTLVSLFYVDATLSFRLWVIIKFLLVAWIIRALFRLAIENYPLLRGHSPAFLLLTLGKTILYYWLFALLIIVSLVTSFLIDRQIDKIAYSAIYKLVYPEDEKNRPVPGKNPRRYDVDAAIDKYFADKETQIKNQLNTRVENGLVKNADDVAKATNDLFAEVFPPKLPTLLPVFKEPHVDDVLPQIFDTGDWANSLIKRPFNVGYKNERDQHARALKRSTDNYRKKAGRDIGRAISIAKQDLHQNFLDLRLALKARLNRLYSLLDFLAWGSLLLFSLVILKSLLYIYARLFFAGNESDPDRAIQFEAVAKAKQRGSIREASGSIKLTAKMGQWLYVNKDYDFANAPPDEVTPQAARAFFSRFRSGTWHMNRIKPAARANSSDAPYRHIPDHERIIVWTLKPGDSVIFSWRNFVGMNENIDIRTCFSWQLSSLVLGRMFYVVASVATDAANDGSLMLAARGTDGVLKTSQPSNSPDQLLAWQTTTRFQLHANLSMRNVYRSGIQVRAMNSDLAVMHQDERKRKSGVGAFLKYFVVPI